MTTLVVVLTAGLAFLTPTPEVEAPRPDPAVRANRTADRTVGAPWAALAECESDGDWTISAGTFEGGLQWLPSSWTRWRDDDDPPRAYQATAAEEIAAAERYVAWERARGRGGFGPWPACAAKLGLPR